MPASADEVIAKIRAAFPAKRAPGLVLVESSGPRYPGDEYEQTERAFRDKGDWTAIDQRFLDRGENMAATSFMSDAALCFYIPAYMVADLQAALTCVEPSYTLMRGFADLHAKKVRETVAPLFAERGMPPPQTFAFREMALRRWAPLDVEQVDAVIAYLEWVVERDGPRLAAGAVEALATYWHPRAGR